MNNYTESLLGQLKAGKSVDDLAKELTEALNAAKTEYETKSEKIQDGEELADMLNYYVSTYYGNFGQKEKLITREDLETICDSVQELLNYVKEMTPKSKSKDESKSFQCGTQADEDALRRWLRELR